MIKILLLSKEYEEKYDCFVKESSFSSYYYSLSYRKLLKEYLKAQDYYFIAVENNEIKGILPSFITNNKEIEKIMNSLPYYGSNGGIIELDGNSEIKKRLLDSFLDTAKKEKCLTTTIITHPLETNNDIYIKEVGTKYMDERIGQITILPENSANLMDMFDDPRPRNIRKAIKSGITFKFSNTLKDLKFLFLVHKDNIQKIGGIAKDWNFFELVYKNLSPNEYKIVIATYNNQKIAALLLFYYNKTVEYFTPAIKEEYRTLQPLSLLIYEAMKDAIFNKYKYWNWGGTWLSQKGVYDFKKRWGTKDYPYHYYTMVNDTKILNYSRKEILNLFPNFYVIPFDKLKS